MSCPICRKLSSHFTCLKCTGRNLVCLLIFVPSPAAHVARSQRHQPGRRRRYSDLPWLDGLAGRERDPARRLTYFLKNRMLFVLLEQRILLNSQRIRDGHITTPVRMLWRELLPTRVPLNQSAAHRFPFPHISAGALPYAGMMLPGEGRKGPSDKPSGARIQVRCSFG